MGFQKGLITQTGDCVGRRVARDLYFIGFIGPCALFHARDMNNFSEEALSPREDSNMIWLSTA